MKTELFERVVEALQSALRSCRCPYGNCPDCTKWRDLETDLRAAQAEESKLIDAGLLLAQMRGTGWCVAVHNDYHVDGKAMTFWLFTHPNGRWAKGEGATDDEALQQVASSARAAGLVQCKTCGDVGKVVVSHEPDGTHLGKSCPDCAGLVQEEPAIPGMVKCANNQGCQVTRCEHHGQHLPRANCSAGCSDDAGRPMAVRCVPIESDKQEPGYCRACGGFGGFADADCGRCGGTGHAHVEVGSVAVNPEPAALAAQAAPDSQPVLLLENHARLVAENDKLRRKVKDLEDAARLCLCHGDSLDATQLRAEVERLRGENERLQRAIAYQLKARQEEQDVATADKAALEQKCAQLIIALGEERKRWQSAAVMVRDRKRWDAVGRCYAVDEKAVDTLLDVLLRP